MGNPRLPYRPMGNPFAPLVAENLPSSVEFKNSVLHSGTAFANDPVRIDVYNESVITLPTCGLVAISNAIKKIKFALDINFAIEKLTQNYAMLYTCNENLIASFEEIDDQYVSNEYSNQHKLSVDFPSYPSASGNVDGFITEVDGTSQTTETSSIFGSFAFNNKETWYSNDTKKHKILAYLTLQFGSTSSFVGKQLTITDIEPTASGSEAYAQIGAITLFDDEIPIYTFYDASTYRVTGYANIAITPHEWWDYNGVIDSSTGNLA